MQLHYLVILPLRDCFADINVSQGSVATYARTYARCDGIFSIHLTANVPRYLPVKFLKKIG